METISLAEVKELFEAAMELAEMAYYDNDLAMFAEHMENAKILKNAIDNGQRI